MQTALGWAVLLGILAPNAVWDRLAELGASATLCLIVSVSPGCGCWCPPLVLPHLRPPSLTCLQFYAFYIKPVLGATAVVAAMIVGGASLAAVVGFIPTALAEAANGGSYEGAGAAKAATLVAAGTAVVAACTVPRVRLGALASGLFYMCGLLVVVRCYATYWMSTPAGPQPVPYPPNAFAYSLYVGIAVPLAVALPMAWLVLPLPAGRLARGCLASALRALAELGSGAVELMLLDDGSRPAPPDAAAAGAQEAGPPGATAPLPAQLLQADAAIRQGKCRCPCALLVCDSRGGAGGGPRS